MLLQDEIIFISSDKKGKQGPPASSPAGGLSVLDQRLF